MIVGYNLISVADGSVIQTWGGVWGQCPAVPEPVTMPDGSTVYGLAVDVEINGYKLVAWDMDQPVNPHCDGLTFLGRFTDAEYSAIATASMTDMRLMRWMDMLRINGGINLAGQDAADGKAYLVATNLLTSARADLIFSLSNA